MRSEMDEATRRYIEAMNKRDSLGDLEDLSDEIESPEPSRDFAANAQSDQAKLDASKPASETNGASQAGNLLTQGGMMGANPYVMGAGLGLQTLGMVDQAKRQSEQAKIDAYNKKIMAQRSAIKNLFE